MADLAAEAVGLFEELESFMPVLLGSPWAGRQAEPEDSPCAADQGGANGMWAHSLRGIAERNRK
jgi:hypothetical protein